MIDRETAIQWAKDAGFTPSYLCMGYWLTTPDQVQDLITRAQSEAFEQAADKVQANKTAMTDMLANELRALKGGI